MEASVENTSASRDILQGQGHFINQQCVQKYRAELDIVLGATVFINVYL